MRQIVARLLAAVAAGALILGSGVAYASETDATHDTDEAVRVDELPSGAVEARSYPFGSRVLVQEFETPALSQKMTYRIMLPPDYARSNRHYPVLYMLHGVAGDSTEWEELGLLGAADRMIGTAQIEPMIVVLPYGGASFWVNHAGDGQRWADYVVQDVVGNVDRHYRTIPDRTGRAIGGLSMGGEGALQLAFRNPDRFIAVGGHSPSLRTDFDQLVPGAQAYYGDAEAWRTLSPYWLVVDSNAASLLSIALDVGTDDPWRPNVLALHERLTERGIDHEMAIIEGEHDGAYWEANVDHYLAFYASAFYPTLA
jgi:S-formylglutathione hydrolase FrmB